MLIFLIVLLGIIFINIYPVKENTFHSDYCSPKQTAAINGIFTILIFLSHASQYVILDGHILPFLWRFLLFFHFSKYILDSL